MKYTFTNRSGNQQTITIPDEYIKVNCRNLKITQREAIEMYLYDEGYIDNAEADALTEAASKNKMRVQGERKKRERKSDEVKRAFIAALAEFMESTEVQNVRVENPERIIAFDFKGDVYNITLSRKRKPKD